MEKIILTTFTDPMMGLSYEQEPVYEKLANHYGSRLEFKYVMAGLVRDVNDFMLPEELALPTKEGIRRYNSRLAQIYLAEEPIGGLPMKMDGFHLFDAEHRSSYPLCIAYKAAQIVDRERADAFLMRLRRATIVETRQTTKKEELTAVAEEVGIDIDKFLTAYESGTAEQAFEEDLRYTRGLGIHSLPSCLIQYKDKGILTSGMLNYEAFLSAIEQICKQ